MVAMGLSANRCPAQHSNLCEMDRHSKSGITFTYPPYAVKRPQFIVHMALYAYNVKQRLSIQTFEAFKQFRKSLLLQYRNFVNHQFGIGRCFSCCLENPSHKFMLSDFFHAARHLIFLKNWTKRIGS